MQDNKKKRVYSGDVLFNRYRNKKHFGTAYNLESVRRVFNEPESTSIKFLTEPNNKTNLPSIWEAGGSHGADSDMYALLDTRLCTVKPNMVNRLNRSLELRHAQQTIWGSDSYLITGNYRKRNHNSKPDHHEVIISLYELASFAEENLPNKRGADSLRGFAYFDLLERSSFRTRAEFEKSTVDLYDPEVYYTHGAYKLRDIANIAKEKLLTFMSFEPLLSKRWLTVDSPKYPPVFSAPTQMVDCKTIKEIYTSISELCWKNNLNQKRARNQYMKLEFLPTEDKTINIIALHNSGITYQTTLDFHELKLFWFPNQDPWNPDGLAQFRNSIIKTTAEVVEGQEPEFELNGEESEPIILQPFSKLYRYYG